MAALTHSLFLLVFVAAAPTLLESKNPVAAAALMVFAALGGWVLLCWGAGADLQRTIARHKRETLAELPASTSNRHYRRLRRAWGEKTSIHKGLR